jgi:hypothetical protein
MPSLTEEQRLRVLPLLAALRESIDREAAGDPALRHQIRRYIAKRLEFDERGTPTARRKLKDLKFKLQKGLCNLCLAELPSQGAELDRFKAIDGYTEANTQLLCHACHTTTQKERDAALLQETPT